jgi:hypothetical protein
VSSDQPKYSVVEWEPKLNKQLLHDFRSMQLRLAAIVYVNTSSYLINSLYIYALMIFGSSNSLSP